MDSSIGSSVFDPHYPLDRIQPALYNPRVIDDESFAALRASIRTLGIIKPLIITRSGVIVAGHQRRRATIAEGITHGPVFLLEEMSVEDEVRFNQLHNGSDMDAPDIALRIPAQPEANVWITLPPDVFDGPLIARQASRRSEISRMLIKHGQWGAVVATQSGEVLTNQLYANACRVLEMPCLIRVVPDEAREAVIARFSVAYGSYSYSHLPKQTWAQSMTQMMRLRNMDDPTKKQNASTAYTYGVLPHVSRSMRILDFGSGQMDYVRFMTRRGYDIRGIEFYFRSGKRINVSAVHRAIDGLCADLATRGRYDLVVCDSVLNSVDSVQAERDVLTCLNALCRPGGFIVFSGRSRVFMERIEQTLFRKSDPRKRTVYFLDADGISAMYTGGYWQYQKFHTRAELHTLFTHYLGPEYRIVSNAGNDLTRHSDLHDSSWATFGHKGFELPAADVEASLSREFNLPLPQGRSYGRSEDIIRAYHAALALEQNGAPTHATPTEASPIVSA